MRVADGAPVPHRLRVLALPPLAFGFAASLAERLSRNLRMPVQLETEPMAPEPVRVPGRDQWDARRLLEDLEARPLAQGELRLAVTAHDLAVPVFSFVFGLARERQSVALVSLARLDPSFYGLPPDPARTLTRTLGEALHELGHLAGLAHCGEAECLMRFAGTLDKADARGSVYCVDCRARLPSWFSASPRPALEKKGNQT